MGGLFSTEQDSSTSGVLFPPDQDRISRSGVLSPPSRGTSSPFYQSSGSRAHIGTRGGSRSSTSSSSSAGITTGWDFLQSSRSQNNSTNFKSRSGLKRMYGYFKCPKCRKVWESSHVYCKAGTTVVEYGQACKGCEVVCKPYRVENLVCSVCGMENCICTDKNSRHTDLAKHHRKDLCEKCKAGRPCV